MEQSLLHPQLVNIKSHGVEIEGSLAIPEHPIGIVLFAHGSGSSRFSQRNNFVAAALHERHIATLLIDLLTPREDVNYQRRFDITLLAQRLDAAFHWLQRCKDTCHLPFAVFGASTGAAAAIRLAAQHGEQVAALVSRGGRPDLAGHEALTKIQTPSLLIVGGNDEVVGDLNRNAMTQMRCIKRLEIIPGATHLFEEPEKLETVAVLAAQWFDYYLKAVEEHEEVIE